MYDILIIGGGSRSLSAALYAGKKGLSVAVIADEVGGQLVTHAALPRMSFLGSDRALIMQNLRKAVTEQGVTILDEQGLVKNVSFRQENNKEIFVAEDQNGGKTEGRSVILASGRRGRKLGIAGEEQFADKGLAYHISPDPALYKGRIVCIIGGGNSGLALAMQLSGVAKQLIIIEKVDRITGDPMLCDALAQEGKTTFILNSDVKEIVGKETVERVAYEDKSVKEAKEIEVDEVIVSIGMIPNSEIAKELCELNKWGEIVVNPRTNATSHLGIFAAGDVTDIADKEAPIAAGEGVKAAFSCMKWLEANI